MLLLSLFLGYSMSIVIMLPKKKNVGNNKSHEDRSPLHAKMKDWKEKKEKVEIKKVRRKAPCASQTHRRLTRQPRELNVHEPVVVISSLPWTTELTRATPATTVFESIGAASFVDMHAVSITCSLLAG